MSEKASRKETKQKRRILEGRIERTLERLSYLTLFNLTFAVLLTNAELLFLKRADMLFPFKMLIICGFAYLSSYSSHSIYLHYTEKKLKNPNELCGKILSSIFSLGTMFYALPSALNLSYFVDFNISFETPVIIAFCFGFFAAIAGMALSFNRMTKRKSGQ